MKFWANAKILAVTNSLAFQRQEKFYNSDAWLQLDALGPML